MNESDPAALRCARLKSGAHSVRRGTAINENDPAALRCARFKNEKGSVAAPLRHVDRD